MPSKRVEDAKKNISQHLDALEIKIKNSKAYWRRCEYNIDRKFVLTFIDSHYNEIVNHVVQIKHHLEKINYHKKELEDVKAHFLTQPITKSDQDETKTSVQDETKTSVQDHTENTTPRRSIAEKQRVKSLRSARCTASKYVHQWEKMIDEQKDEISVIKRRLTGGAKPKSEASEDVDVSKIMVKSRVLQFEKNQKYKRASSTIDAFLDYCTDKPNRGVSCPDIEEIELISRERPISKEFETASGDSTRHSFNSDSRKFPKKIFEVPEYTNIKFDDDHIDTGNEVKANSTESQEIANAQSKEESSVCIPKKDIDEDNLVLQEPQEEQVKTYIDVPSEDNKQPQHLAEDNHTDNIKNHPNPLQEIKNVSEALSNYESPEQDVTDTLSNLQKIQEEQFKSCIDITCFKENKDFKREDKDKPTDEVCEDGNRKSQEFKNMIDHLHDIQSRSLPSNNPLAHDGTSGCNIAKETIRKDNENKLKTLDEEGTELSKPADQDKIFTIPPITQQNKIEEQEEHTKEDSRRHIEDIIEGRANENESALSLLDDVNALLEDDHLKIIRKKKSKVIKANIEHERNVEINVILPMKEVSSFESCEDFSLSANFPTKPRIVEIHYKKDLPPDVLLQTVQPPQLAKCEYKNKG